MEGEVRALMSILVVGGDASNDVCGATAPIVLWQKVLFSHQMQLEGKSW
jgi:hypothetical protein